MSGTFAPSASPLDRAASALSTLWRPWDPQLHSAEIFVVEHHVERRSGGRQDQIFRDHARASGESMPKRITSVLLGVGSPQAPGSSAQSTMFLAPRTNCAKAALMSSRSV